MPKEVKESGINQGSSTPAGHDSALFYREFKELIGEMWIFFFIAFCILSFVTIAHFVLGL